MLIGIISDTHNEIDLTQVALDIMRDRGVEFIIHAGDMTSPRMLSIFEGFTFKGVLGNGDLDVEALNEEAQKLGFGCIEKQCTFELEGKQFIVFHGNDVPLFREAVTSGNYDYIIKGHTHFFEDYKSGKTRIINPGCLYGHDECSIAILDTETDRVEMISMDTL